MTDKHICDHYSNADIRSVIM